MSFIKSWSALLLGACLVSAPAVAQTGNAGAKPSPGAEQPQTSTASPAAMPGGEPHYVRPETPEQRKQRLGTWEDPGPDPDPKKGFIRFGHLYHIERFDRGVAAFDQREGWVRPIAYANIPAEIYQLNDLYVWAWMLDPTEYPKPPEPLPDNRQTRKYDEAALSYLRNFRPEFQKLSPPESGKTIRFEESSEGLPDAGSWRNSLAVADMNGDGFPDIIAPPQRGGNGLPTIFLGDGKGHWKVWDTVKWPYALNYGSVVAADFNHDGHMDLAFAVHLNGLHVWLGDGKGNFTDASEGLPNDWPTRRVVAADIDKDGWVDLVAISEGPTPLQTTNVYPKLMVFLNGGNKGTKWTRLDVSQPRQQFGSDWLAVGDFNGDGIPDFAGSSVYFNGTEILYLSEGPKSPKKWKGVGAATTIPYYSYHFANAAGRFVKGSKRDDAIISYVRAWPADVDPRIVPDPPLKQVVGLDRVSFQGKEPQRVAIARWEGNAAVTGMAAVDVDGDGNLDIAYVRAEPRAIVVLLGDGKGGFQEARVEGVALLDNPIYDIKLVDLNGDGKPDLLVAYESGAGGITSLSRPTGSIHVYLNRGTSIGQK
jgi:FG-GAP-like repeat